MPIDGHQPPGRLADVSIAVSLLVIDIMRFAHTRPPFNRFSLGAAAELILVSMYVAAETRADRPPSQVGIARALSIPRANVQRALKTLTEARRVRRGHGNFYFSDIDMIERDATPELIERISDIIARAHQQIRELTGS